MRSRRDSSSTSGVVLAVGVRRRPVLGGELVGVDLVGVRARPAGHPAVLLVDADDLLPDQPPGAVDEGEHERGDAEGDDDRGEDQRLRQRIAMSSGSA